MKATWISSSLTVLENASVAELVTLEAQHRFKYVTACADAGERQPERGTLELWWPYTMRLLVDPKAPWCNTCEVHHYAECIDQKVRDNQEER
jgi:hypothetical protein